MKPFLKIENLQKSFTSGRKSSIAVRDVNLEIAQGEFIAFIGHSGCGKSTVLNMIAGLYPPSSGQVTIDGRVVKGPGSDRAMVFQNYSLLPWMSVQQNVFQAVDSVFEQNYTKAEKQAMTERVLRLVNLWQHRHKKPSQLSGGMKQRVAIARAFAIRPEVLLMDEPFGALDALTKSSLHEELLRAWSESEVNGKRQTILMVTHDIDEAIYLADRIVVMTNGPAATVGEILEVKLPRPRDKREMIHSSEYADLKERLLELLEDTFGHKAAPAPTPLLTPPAAGKNFMNSLFSRGVGVGCGLLIAANAALAQPASTPAQSEASTPAAAGPSTAPVTTSAAPVSKPGAAVPASQAIKIGEFTLSGSVRARYENWKWFDTPGFDDDYDFGGVLLRAGLSRSWKNYDVNVELAAPLLIGLPNNAAAPPPQGQLGLGASYEAANMGQDAGLFAKQAFVKIKNLGGPANSLKLGRFEFWDGSEVIPKNPTLAALKRDRIAQRLLGNFGFTHIGRSFDGVMFSRSTPGSNITFNAMRPTEGVFDLDGMGEVKDVDVLYASYNKPMKNADARIFALHYRDDRQAPESIKVDNRPGPLRVADRDDIAITSVGGHFLKTVEVGDGEVDLLAWGALQRGDWGGLKHRAHAFALEAGYQPQMKWKPWLRAGFNRGSGDKDNLDGTHQTFFQVLPTPRIYARTPFYNMMNNDDLFASLILRPSPKLSLRADAHRLKLSEKNDLWYSGGGAFQDNSFGYAGRPSFGDDKLATLFDLSIDYASSPTRSFGAYIGHARGGKVIENIYAGKSLTYFYLEATQKF